MIQWSKYDMKKRYENGFEAVKNLDLEVNDGEFLVLLGPSGCGKSTTLRMLAGLEDISEGNIMIDGAKVNDLPPGARGLGMVFQSYATCRLPRISPLVYACPKAKTGCQTKRLSGESRRLPN